jgi:hypothetical protein
MEISNKPQSDNMIVGNCVACDGLVRIPLHANPNSIVRCPRCSADFKLIDVLERAAPILEVVGDQSAPEPEPRKPRFVPILDETPPQPDGRKRGDKFVVSPILQKNSKRKKHRRRHRSSESGGSSPPNSSPPNGTSTATPIAGSATSAEPSLEIDQSRGASPVSVGVRSGGTADKAPVQRTAPRRPQNRRSSSNRASRSNSGSGLELTKIILGAVLALPVAQLLIWWFAGTDPLNLGPMVSRIAPFVVPAEFQPEKQKDKDEFFKDDGPVTDLNDLAGANGDLNQ